MPPSVLVGMRFVTRDPVNVATYNNDKTHFLQSRFVPTKTEIEITNVFDIDMGRQLITFKRLSEPPECSLSDYGQLTSDVFHKYWTTEDEDTSP